MPKLCQIEVQIWTWISKGKTVKKWCLGLFTKFFVSNTYNS